MKLKQSQRVRAETAEQRGLEALDPNNARPASMIANAIWPDHEMRAQGAGAAASRILKRLEKTGRARYTTVYRNGRPTTQGWIRC